MDTKVLREIQRLGWIIESVGKDACVVKCPEQGCGMRARIRKDTGAPPRLNERVETDIEAKSFDEVRQMLRARRLELALSIPEIEEAAGLTTDHLAKFERPDFSKIPNLDTVIYWAGALGFELVLRPAELPPMTLRMITETRPILPQRRRRQETDRLRAQAGRKQG